MNHLIQTASLVMVTLMLSCHTKREFNPDITSDELYKHIDFLSSDSLFGRSAGTPFDRVSAKYIKDQFEKSGLELIGDNGYHFFDLITNQYSGPDNSMVINGKSYTYSNDFATFPFSSSGTLEAPVVFAGFGLKIENQDMSWNDYKELNVEGKWVMLLRGDPEPDKPESIFINQSSDRNKVLLAKDQGAKGVILVSGVNYDPQDQLVTMEERGYSIGIPVIHIHRNIANLILQGNGKLEKVEKEIIEKRTSKTIETGLVINATTEVLNEIKTSQNIVAIIRSNTEKKNRKYIVIGAHYDHIGMGGKGSSSRRPDTISVHNGADDNASGISAMIEIAQKLSENRTNLSRNLIFVAFGAEEQGLIGSRRFIESGIVPVDSIEAMINLDMLGRMTNNTLMVSGVKTAVESEGILHELNTDSTIHLLLSPEGYGPSDHASFYNKDIPVFFFTTGVHLDYHTPDDDINLINVDGLSKSASYIYSLIEHLAKQNDYLTFQQAGPKSLPVRHGKGLKVKLGIIPDVSGMANNGLRVIGATEGNPAYIGGIRAGDVITAINGKSVKNIQDYMYRLSELKQGITISVEIQRQEKQMVLLVQL